MNNQDFYSIKEATEALGIERHNFYYLVKKGKVKIHSNGLKKLVLKSDINQLLEINTTN